MKHTCSDHTPSLESIQEQFEAWRAGKAAREPIPDHLWAAAARLCFDHPITQVCRVLRLSFNELKKHQSGTKAIRFTELDFGAIANPWQIDCQRTDGSRLRVTSAGPLPDLAGLLQDFLA